MPQPTPFDQKRCKKPVNRVKFYASRGGNSLVGEVAIKQADNQSTMRHKQIANETTAVRKGMACHAIQKSPPLPRKIGRAHV